MVRNRKKFYISERYEYNISIEHVRIMKNIVLAHIIN